MKGRNKFIQTIINLFFIVLCACIVMPFVLLISISLSNEQDIVMYGYSILPRKLDFTAYKYVLDNSSMLFNAYKITGIFSAVSMVAGVLLMAMIAYPLSVYMFKARRMISFYLYFTMLFSGGLVASYILITRYLHLTNTIWVYIIPGLINPWYVFMMRSFMQGIPKELREAVKIDGGKEFTVFFKIILPLSKPVLATIALYVFLAKWNDWNTAMLYINDDNLISIQYFLQRILQNLELLNKMRDAGITVEEAEIPSETVRMALAIFVAGPALFVFPFFQKYFVKGMTVGSVKG